MKTNRQLAYDVARKWMPDSPVDSMRIAALMAHVELALDEAVREAIMDAGNRAMALMQSLNTDYRHEIADVIRAAGDSE